MEYLVDFEFSETRWVVQCQTIHFIERCNDRMACVLNHYISTLVIRSLFAHYLNYTVDSGGSKGGPWGTCPAPLVESF